MCKFCDNFKEFKHYKVPYRTCYTDDNTCEFGSPENYDGTPIQEDGICYRGTMTCEDCDGCADDNLYFSLYAFDNRIQLGFYHKIKKLIISPCAEPFEINYCPWCGKKLCEQLVDFNKCCVGRGLELSE